MQAVIFDLDGVLCNTVEYHYRSWKKVTAQYGIPFRREDNMKLLGLTRRSSLEVILGDRQVSEQQMQEMLRLKNEYYLEYVKQITGDDLLPGIRELVNEIAGANLRVGVASGSSNTALVLQRLGIGCTIDAVVDGNTVARSKPYPDVFLKTAWSLQVSPGACLAIEDSPAGVQAARSARMCVVGVGSPDDLEQAHTSYPSLAGVQLSELVELYQHWENANLERWEIQPVEDYYA